MCYICHQTLSMMTVLLFMALLVQITSAFIELDVVLLGYTADTSSIASSVLPVVASLTNATSITTVSTLPDALLGNEAKRYFPSGSFYSFTLVNIIRAHFTLTTPNDSNALRSLQCCLDRPLPDNRAVALDYAEISAPSSWLTNAWTAPSPTYVAIIGFTGWALTVVFLLGFWFCCRRQPPSVIPSAVVPIEMPVITRPRPDDTSSFTTPQSAGQRPRPPPRGKPTNFSMP